MIILHVLHMLNCIVLLVDRSYKLNHYVLLCVIKLVIHFNHTFEEILKYSIK